MDFVVDSVKLAANVDQWTTMRQRLKGKIDLLLTTASQLDESGSSTQLLNTIDQVSAPIYSAGVAILLAIQAESLPDSCVNKFLTTSKILFSAPDSFKEHFLFVSADVTAITSKLVKLCCRANKPKATIRTLIHASSLVAPSPYCLTPIHASVLQTCILGQAYTLAADFLRSQTILEIDPVNTSLSALDYLRYFYYAGICFIGVKDYSAALDHFLQAITLPAQALSAVVIQSIRKARLVSLINDGTEFKVPKYASSIVNRYAKQDTPHYDDVVKHFLAGNVSALKEAVTKGSDAFNRDHNLGLAKQTIAALTRHTIRKLTSTYITLSLADIAQAAGLSNAEAAEKQLLKMVSSGEIRASINQQTGMVTFSDGDENNVAAENAESDLVLKQLEVQIGQSMGLADTLRNLQQKVLTSREYVSRSSSAGRGFGPSSFLGGSVEGVGWGDADEFMDIPGGLTA